MHIGDYLIELIATELENITEDINAAVLDQILMTD